MGAISSEIFKVHIFSKKSPDFKKQGQKCSRSE